MMATPSALDAYLGKPMGDICTHGPARAQPHHRGAQFVGHVLRFQFERDHGCRACECAAAEHGAVTMCVERLFHRAPRKGLWAQRPRSLSPCLVFVAPGSHVRCIGQTWMMACNPANQVGVYLGGTIWSYCEERARVISEREADFFDRCSAGLATRRRTLEYLYGEIPD